MALEFPSDFPFHRQVKEQPAPGPAPAASRPAVAVPQIVMTHAPARPPAADRRRAPRQTLVAKASIRPDTPVQMPSLIQHGFVSNISMNGVGFHTRKPLEVGAKYRIVVEVGPLKWSSRLRLVSCRHHEDSETFDCGAEFIGNELHRHAAAA